MSHLLSVCSWRWHAIGSLNLQSTDLYYICGKLFNSNKSCVPIYKIETMSTREVIMSLVSGICWELPGLGCWLWQSGKGLPCKHKGQNSELCGSTHWGSQTRDLWGLLTSQLTQVCNFQEKVSRPCLQKTWRLKMMCSCTHMNCLHVCMYS